MQIKRLELQGFKSFKDKTVIHFDDGITGIVGPNGCGKSNVVDAFFWVMGEQNARHLRGQSMDDLIFSGADKAPPASSAEVTLILEMPSELTGPNAPAGASATEALATREVAVTRKLYRTGESDYFINKTPCRLRDIQELFMDTGVGARGYSIIQQGQIAKLVQAKPEDRRTMIEEVAGIVKYKTRRKESMRKLEGTQQNLLRVSDVIRELDTQKRQMERQADKARKYKEWKEKLQSIELHFNALKWEDVSGKISSLENELETLDATDMASASARESVETQISQKRLEAAQANNITDEFQKKWMAAGQELNNSENELKYSQKNIEDLRSSSMRLEKDVEAERALVEQLQEEYENLSAENESIVSVHTEAEEARQNAENAANQQKRRAEEIERNTNQNRNRLLQLSSELEKARNQENLAKIRLEELNANLSRIEQDKAEREIILSESSEAKELASAKLQEVKSEVNEIRATQEAAVEETRKIHKEIDEQRRTVNTLTSEQARTKATLHSLEEQKNRHEASSKGVKAIFQQVLSKNEAWKSSVKGTLADFLEVEKGLETAAEASLGRALDLILTTNSSLHKELSQSLKTGSLGRASFAGLDAARGRAKYAGENFSVPAEFTQEVRGPLTNFVQLQTKTAPEGASDLLTYLLNKIIVVNTLEAAQKLAERFPEHSFVTIDGEVLRGGWFLEGGDRNSVSGAHVNRNREIAELGEKLESLTQELHLAKEKLQVLENSLQETENKKRALETELREKQNTLSQLSTEEATLSARHQEAERNLRQLTQELERIAREQQRYIDQEISAKESSTLLEVQKNELETELEGASESLQLARVELESLQQTLLDTRLRAASIAESKNTIQARLKTAETSLTQHSQRVETMYDQAQRKQTEAVETLSRIEELTASISILRTDLVQAEQEYRISRDRLDILNNEVEELRNAAQSHSTKERELKNQLMTKRLDLQRITTDRDALTQNTFERYGITLAEYAVLPETQEQIQLLREAGESAISEIQNEVTLLREKIRKLGEVNPGAVEEYDQIVDRFNFLSSQKADLERSMADLQDTIDKINKVSKDRFERAFGEVNAHFKRVFPVIFGGGHAHLTLTNPEDMLETGVDITAQPPGKKAQNINLLSGGEKTLTAISLLFAVFLVKPSPFCLLDEVDAPLDDANIGRFNALLREMAKRSQFIIITHNKRTMELNDKLYGVTMEDAGVSKMVSIQLSASA